MTLKPVITAGAPEPIGAYSQGICAGDFVFISGQIPIDPKTNDIICGDIRVQTDLVITSIENILKAEGLVLSDVVKSEIFLKDLDDFQDINEIYASRFSGEIKPARVVIQAAKLPKDVGVEISCIAYRTK